MDAAAQAGDQPQPQVIVAAGDISCKGCAQKRTAELIQLLSRGQRLAAILPLGDEAYLDGALREFQANYAPTWGTPELFALSHPVPGNHEYAETDGDGYFDYYDGVGKPDGVAGVRGQGYYSFDIGSWHLVALNTSDGCHAVSCDVGSAQQKWLAANLAAHPTACSLAFWHHPRFQGGTESGETEAVGPLWETFHDSGGDVVVNAHEHNYQQLAPLDDQARPTLPVASGPSSRGQAAPAFIRSSGPPRSGNRDARGPRAWRHRADPPGRKLSLALRHGRWRGARRRVGVRELSLIRPRTAFTATVRQSTSRPGGQ